MLLTITHFSKRLFWRRMLTGLMLWFAYLFIMPLIFYLVLPTFAFYTGLILTLESVNPLLNGDALFLVFEAGVGTFLIFVPAVICWPIGVFDDK